MVRFNDTKGKIINLDYIEKIDFDPIVIEFEEGNFRYIRFDFVSGNNYTLKYTDLNKYYKDKQYLENNLIVDIK